VQAEADLVLFSKDSVQFAGTGFNPGTSELKDGFVFGTDAGKEYQTGISPKFEDLSSERLYDLFYFEIVAVDDLSHELHAISAFSAGCFGNLGKTLDIKEDYACKELPPIGERAL
jgi:hypothetical protein